MLILSYDYRVSFTYKFNSYSCEWLSTGPRFKEEATFIQVAWKLSDDSEKNRQTNKVHERKVPEIVQTLIHVKSHNLCYHAQPHPIIA